MAVAHVGHSYRSDTIWKEYISFINSWPEESEKDKSLKQETLYNLYKRIIEIPVNGLEKFWEEYLTLEKMRTLTLSKQQAEVIIKEAQDKYEHRTKRTHESRSYYAHGVDFDRIAVPATNESSELQLLEAWDEWFKYELTNPLELDSATHYKQMTFLYQQAISTLRYHPEVWLAHADYVLDHEGFEKSMTILETSIWNIPGSVVLRLQIAELEERFATNVESTSVKVGGKRKHDIQGEEEKRFSFLVSRLRTTFFDLPNPFTFSLWQRAARQEGGIRAGRDCFNETLSLRVDSPTSSSSNSKKGEEGDPTPITKAGNKKIDRNAEKHRLAYGIYFAHAQLELDVNNDAKVALCILIQTQKLYPKLSAQDIDYIQLLVKILSQLGDYEQLRWHFESLLQSPDKIVIGKTAEHALEGSVTGNSVGGVSKVRRNMPTIGRDSLLSSSLLMNLTKKQKLQLCKQYYALELKSGQASVSALRKLRERLQSLQQEVEVEASDGSSVNSTVIDINDIGSAHMDIDELESSGANERRVTSALLYPSKPSSSDRTEATTITTTTTVIMKAAILLYERFGYVIAQGKLPKEDYMLMQRCFLNELLDETLRNDRLRESRDDPMKRFERRGGREIEEIASRLQLPRNLTDFLYKLPYQVNVSINSDLFVEKLRKLVLPLRPSDTQFNRMARGSKVHNDKDDMDVQTSAPPVVEDVFKQRAKKRLEEMQQFPVTAV